MKKLFIAILIGCLFLVGCGINENEVTQENNVVENTSEVVQDTTILESESEDIEATSTMESETNEETSTMENENETVEDTSTMESENIEEPAPSEEVAPTYTFVDMNATMYAKQSVNVRDIPSKDGNKLGGLTTNQEVVVTGQCNETSWYRIEYNGNVGYVSNNYLVSEKVEEATASPSTTSSEGTSNVDYGNGDDLAFTGTLTLPSGLTISTLNKFNACGMDTSSDNSWMGDIYSDIVAQNFETMATNFDLFNEMYSGGAINIISGEEIWWRMTKADGPNPSLKIKKCDDHYRVVIANPCLDVESTVDYGWVEYNASDEARAREALTVLLSAITSTPGEIQHAILQTTYDAAEDEPWLIDGDGAWTNIGDCQIKLSAWDFTEGRHIVIFRVRPQ